MAALSMAASAAVSCSIEEMKPEQVQDNVITMVTTLSPKSGMVGKALSDPADGTIKAKWAVGEELYMVYQNTNNEELEAKATVTKVASDGSATMSVDLVNPKSAEFKIAYPYSTYHYDPSNPGKDIFLDQIGTLEDISANYDMSDGIANLVVDNDVASVPGGISLDRAVSIWKFTLNAGGSDITGSVTSLAISTGDLTYTVSPSGLSAIYVAVFPIQNAAITVTAVTPSGTYSKSRESVTLEAGRLYVSTGLELEAAAPTTKFTYTATEKLTVFDDFSNFTGATALQSHSFANGAGTVVYDGVVTAMADGVIYYDKTARSAITSITLPASLTAVSSMAFYNCASLASVTFAPGSSVVTIGSRSFYQCGALTSIAIPDSVQTIEENAFYGCSALSSVTFPETSSLTTIKNGVFWNCTGLKSITLPESLTTIGWYQEIDNKTYYNGSVFWNAGLTSIEIPKNLTTIYGGGHLGNCPLTSVTVNAQNPKYYSINGANAVFEKNTDRLIMGCASTTVPNGTKAIGYEAFFGEEREFSLELPASVTAIEARAFHLATGLKAINIPEGVTEIPEETFMGCGFTTLTIPDSVTSIGEIAFMMCDKLTTLYLGSGLTTISDNAFWCPNVTDIYCTANPANLTWDGNGFADNKATKFHVTDIAAWQARFPDANVTFVGEGGGSQQAGTYRVYTDGTQYTDVAIPDGAITVTSSTTAWSAGTYVVSSDVAISETITLSGDANLILCDGAELTVNGCIFGGADYDHGFIYSLSIYGQTSGTGKLTIDYSGDHSLGVLTASNLIIHGGEITVGGSGVFQGIEPRELNVYHGTVEASGIANGILAMSGGIHIYGGELTASSTAYGQALCLPEGGSTMTVSGGKVKATTAATAAAIDIADNCSLIISGGEVYAEGGQYSEGIIVYGTCTVSGGEVTAIGGPQGGIGLEGNTTITGGIVTAVGGDGVAGEMENGAAGYDGALSVSGGKLIATGGAKAGSGADGLGISDGSTIELGNGVVLYEGASPNPATAAANQAVCTKRYAIIE